MDKKVYREVMERAGGYCEECGRNTKLSIHHAISGRGKRQKYETIESCFALCWHCHQGPQGVHNNRQLEIKLKIIAQNRYRELGYAEDEIREKMGGRIYIEGCDVA